MLSRRAPRKSQVPSAALNQTHSISACGGRPPRQATVVRNCVCVALVAKAGRATERERGGQRRRGLAPRRIATPCRRTHAAFVAHLSEEIGGPSSPCKAEVWVSAARSEQEPGCERSPRHARSEPLPPLTHMPQKAPARMHGCTATPPRSSRRVLRPREAPPSGCERACFGGSPRPCIL